MKRILLIVAVLFACGAVAHAQESEFSSSGGGGVSTAGGSGTAGVVPQFASASSLVDSKMLTSGTNSGTWTLYDSTSDGTGLSRLTIRQGDSSPDQAGMLLIYANDGVTEVAAIRHRTVACAGCGSLNIAQVQDIFQQYYALSNGSIVGSPGLLLTTNSRLWISSENNNFSGLNNGVSLMYDSPGIAKLADATTGFTGLVGASFGAKTTNGALANVQTISESITLAAAATTDSTADLCPANSIILSVTWRITTSIAGVDSTTLSVGDPTIAARFGTGTVFTAGTTGIGITQMSGASVLATTGPTQGTAAKLRLTLSGGADNVPSGGVVRVTVTYLSLTPPTS